MSTLRAEEQSNLERREYARQRKMAQSRYLDELSRPMTRPNVRTPSPTPGEDFLIDATPAPGEYMPGPYLGLRSRTPPRFSFGKQDRDKEKRVYQGMKTDHYVVSPGPGNYDLDDSAAELASKGRRFGPGPDYVSGYVLNRRADDIRRPGPGPGEYDARFDTFGTKSCTFGSGDRKEPYTVSAAASVDYLDTDMVMAGDRLQRPGSPSFNFGTASFRVDTNINVKKPAAMRPTTSSGVQSDGSEGGHSRRPKTSGRRRFRKPPPNNNYDWIYGGNKPGKKNGSSGGGMSSFGSGTRELFPRGGPTETPGPDQYQACPSPGAIGANFARYESSLVGRGMMPGFAFTKASDRTPPEIKKKIRDNEPGPGAYNLQLEHRLKDMLREDNDFEEEEKRRSEEQEKRGQEDQPALTLLIPSDTGNDFESVPLDESASLGAATGVTSGGRSRKSTWSLEDSLGGRSVQSAATDLGLKFGDIPTSPMAPAWSFGTGARSGREKLFQGQDELTMSMTESPGPGTAKINMPYADGRPGSPEFTMLGANVERNPIPFQNNNVGPARLGQFSCVGPGSIYKSPAPTFGVSTRDQTKKMFMGPGF